MMLALPRLSWPVLSILGVLLATAVIRLGLLDIPLDRDEGEYAYMGQLILQGVPPYVEAYNMKMPGIYALYAGILAVVGETPAAIHVGLLVVNAVAIVLVFLLGWRLVSPTVGVASAVAFAALAMSPAVLGLAAYAEQFVVVPALGGVLVLLRAQERRSGRLLLCAGALFGLAFLVKQSGGAFALFAVVWVLLEARTNWRRGLADAALLGVGAVLPFAVASLILGLTGSLGNFWFWTFQYASQYASQVPAGIGLQLLWMGIERIARSAPLLALTIAIGVLVLLRDPTLRGRRLVIGLFALFSALAVTPGLYFRAQYFVLALPAAALLAGLVPAAVARGLEGHRSAAIALACTVSLVPAAHAIWTERGILFEASPDRAARVIYGANPFPESLVIADYLRRNSVSDDAIAVLGSEPQIYFYTGRRAATAYIYMYPLMEQHPYAAWMQQDLIRQVEAARPKFLVVVNVGTSWLPRPTSDKTVWNWLVDYGRGFEKVGVVDILPAETRYLWDEGAATYIPQSPAWVMVLRRRSDAS